MSEHTPEACYETYQDAGLCRQLVRCLCNSGMAPEILSECRAYVEDAGDDCTAPEDGAPEDVREFHRFAAVPALVDVCQKFLQWGEAHPRKCTFSEMPALRAALAKAQ